jgi:membrane fusion protein (multidrug efflux system)
MADHVLTGVMTFDSVELMKPFVFAVVLGLTLPWTQCRNPKQPAGAGGPPPGGFAVPVETAVATTETVMDKISAVGSIEPNEIVDVRSEISGRITAVSFVEGAPVKKGDVLFQLDDAKLQADVQLAGAEFAKARNNLDRTRKLLEQQAISPREFDDAQAEFTSAEARLTLAREQLADATIVSPHDGMISQRLVSPQQFIEKNQTLVTVVDTDPMKIDFSVPERFMSQLRIGQQVDVTLVALPGRAFRGEVYFIDPRVDASTRTIKLKARLPNPDNALRAGLFANVSLVAGQRENAVVAPEQAVVPLVDKNVVFIVTDGKAQRREIVIGARLPGRVEIVSGVNAGDHVVIAGQQKLRDLAPVMPMPPAPATPAPAPAAGPDGKDRPSS